MLENCRTALWLFKLTLQGASSAEDRHGAVVCCLTFEVRRDRQQDAWPGRTDDMPSPAGRVKWLAVGPRFD